MSDGATISGVYSVCDEVGRPMQTRYSLREACLAAVDALLRVKDRTVVKVWKGEDPLFSLTMDKEPLLYDENHK